MESETSEVFEQSLSSWQRGPVGLHVLYGDSNREFDPHDGCVIVHFAKSPTSGCAITKMRCAIDTLKQV